MKNIKLFIATFLTIVLSPAILQASYNSTGGTVPDAAWSGDTPQYTGNTNVGALAGEGGVSGGSASYSIPINVIPGRNGMQPSVSLNYSSDGGNGIAGMGWGLSVGSAISRCGRTVAQDGNSDKVHYLKAKDRLCFNGQRMVAVSGTYGNSGTQYRTEINNFAKIVQSGDMDGTSTYFTVTYKNGYKDVFGGSTTSRQKPYGQSKINTWAISKSADVSGNNTMTYSYNSYGRGEYNLKAINYTGGSTTSGNRVIEFTYEIRPDTNSGYMSGGLTASTKRLKTITTKYSTTKVREYRLVYSQSTMSGNSLLKSAQECGYTGTTAHCFPATTFEWYQNAPTYKLEKLQYKNASNQNVWVGNNVDNLRDVLPSKDVNGDGTLDWPSIFVNAESKYKGSHNSNIKNCVIYYEEHSPRCVEADFNQDGKTDSWRRSTTANGTYPLQIAYTVGTNAGTYFNTGINLYSNLSYGQDKVDSIADYNGDGYLDIAIYREPSHQIHIYWHTKNHAAPYSASKFRHVYTVPRYKPTGSLKYVALESVQYLGDFDGNGISDLFIHDSTIPDNLVFNGTGYAFYTKPQVKSVMMMQPASGGITYSTKNIGVTTAPGSTIPNYAHSMWFDINSDGLQDLLSVVNSDVKYKINKGNGNLGNWKTLTGGNLIVTKSKKGNARQNIGTLEEPFYFSEPRLVGNYVFDYDMDGRTDMLLPGTRIVSHCQTIPKQTKTGVVPRRYCDNQTYTNEGFSPYAFDGVLPAERLDRSVYKFDAAKFKVTGYASDGEPLVTVTTVPTTLTGSTSGTAAVDANGNGLTDLLTVIGCKNGYVNDGYSNCKMQLDNGSNSLAAAGLAEGAWINRNVGAYGASATTLDKYQVGDKLKSVTNALSVRNEWDYLPLNTGKTSLYSSEHAHLASTPGYLHFGANINVVSEMRSSNGINGLNKTSYAYKDATLNVFGRGFQGFEEISVSDHANGLHSKTEYHVVWPVSGRVASTKTWKLGENYSSVAPITETTTLYEVVGGSSSGGGDTPPPPPPPPPPTDPEDPVDPPPECPPHICNDFSEVLPDAIGETDSEYVVENTTDKDQTTPFVQVIEKGEEYRVNGLKLTQASASSLLMPMMATGAPVSSLTPASGETQFVIAIKSTTITRDLSTRTELHRKINTMTYDGYGNVKTSSSVYHEPSNRNRNESVTTNIYHAANASSWWVNKLNYSTVLTKTVGTRYDSAAVASGSDHQKQVKTTYAFENTHRKPSIVTTVATQGGGRPTKVSTIYNAYGLPTQVKVEGSAYNSTSYNLADRVTNTTYSDNGTTASASGYFLYTVTNAKGHVTTTQTDPKYGLPTRVTDPNGQVATSTYDAYGRAKSSKAPGEPTQWMAYHWCSGINSGTAWCPSYDKTKYRVMTRKNGAPDDIRYQDQFNREVHRLTRNFLNNNWWRSRRQYNNRGQLVWESNLYDNRNQSTARYTYFDGYDALGRLTQKRTPQSCASSNSNHMVTKYSYSGFNTSINVTHPTGHNCGSGAKTLNMSRKYNGLQQLQWTKDANGKYTRYAYDGAGNPISIQDSSNNKITTRFNALGQKEWVHDPNAGNKSFQYNSLGELEWEKDANNKTLTYRYDTLGRMDRRWTNGVYSGIWSYDNPNTWGRKGMLDYEYNTTTTTDRLTKYYRYARTSGGKDFLSYNVHYIYENGALPASNKHVTYFYMDNNYGRPKGMKYGTTGVTIAYDYTSIGYLQTIKNAASGYIYRQITDQDARGNAVGALLGNSKLTQSQRFHPATGQMEWNRVTKEGSTKLHTLEYDYGAFSNLYQSVVTASNGQENYETYIYDNLHRLTQSVRAFSNGSANNVVNTGYDALGNITNKSDYANTYSYGNAARSAGGNAGPNAVRSISKVSGGTTTYAYDNNGNMTSGDGRSIVYNEFNKPLTITKGSVTTKFSYGANLMRYKQYKYNISGGPQTTYYIDKHFEVEKQGTRTTYRHYIDGVAILNKTVDGSTTWKLGFNLKDHLGSVVTVADHNGAVIEHRSFDPFGKPRRGDFVETTGADKGTIKGAIAQDPHPEQSTDPHTDRGFTDHEHLDEMQLIHMNGRVYDYNIGRFTSVDPFIQGTGSQAMNPYSYIQNNPLSGVDPSGYCATSDKIKDCAGSLEGGETRAITDANGKEVGTVGKDGDGNLYVTKANGAEGRQSIGVAMGAYQSASSIGSQASQNVRDPATLSASTGGAGAAPSVQNGIINHGVSETTEPTGTGFLRPAGYMKTDIQLKNKEAADAAATGLKIVPRIILKLAKKMAPSASAPGVPNVSTQNSMLKSDYNYYLSVYETVEIHEIVEIRNSTEVIDGEFFQNFSQKTYTGDHVAVSRGFKTNSNVPVLLDATSITVFEGALSYDNSALRRPVQLGRHKWEQSGFSYDRTENGEDIYKMKE